MIVSTSTAVADDGHTIGYEVREPGGGDGTTVVFLPALGVPLSYYTLLLDAWAAEGRRVVGVEHRGQPASPIADCGGAGSDTAT
ncbi:hypothetical protein [Actinoplanes sp. NBRC 103695]|uniref:hypothetical protein n=1 Tax=Actinoplanes sp. NBRC 103695 TaxID=3032202 RepID=UPI0024A0AA5D|nr:hypothetical protein [Actinoplanes sp. NBRC 103695]GLY98555.1 hypothetical protein Acsp02_58090 [Actinoplanes sp. NBRC 103695]